MDGVEDDRAEATAGQAPGEPTDYEPPRLTVLGSFAELTQGVVPTTTDGVLPGSIL